MDKKEESELSNVAHVEDMAKARNEIIDILNFNQINIEDAAAVFAIVAAPAIHNVSRSAGMPARSIRKTFVTRLNLTLKATLQEMQQEEWKRGQLND